MGDLEWTQNNYFGYPLQALRYHAVAVGASGSGKTETLNRLAYGACKAYNMQVIFLDAKGQTKREEEEGEDSAVRFVATMRAAGARTIKVFPSLYYNGWQGNAIELKNRLLSIIDTSESAYYGDVASNALDLALHAPTTPRNSSHFLANLQYERLKAIYAHVPNQYQRVLNFDKDLLKQVLMRYQVFFQAMDGQLDGTLDYASADAVYLRVRGFTLRDAAPRLGRFLIYDFMHYIAERRRAGLSTLFIIDEFNALRMREESSILFEQARSFGASLVISAQGYAGLGAPEYANRILDACSTYILHACSDPFQITRRAGKRTKQDTSWNEDEEGIVKQTLRNVQVWRVPENAVLQQQEGQAYWIYRGLAQQVQTVRVPITQTQVKDAWREIRSQEEQQRLLLEEEETRRRTTRTPIEPAAPPPLKQTKPKAQKKSPAVGTKKPKAAALGKTTIEKPTQAEIDKELEEWKPAPRTPLSMPGTPPALPDLDDDDDEPDRL